MRKSFDVAIVGVGPAGAAAALEGSRRGLRLCVIERAAPTAVHVGESLAPECVRDLGELGVHPVGLASAGVEAAWGSPQTTFQSGITNPWGAGLHVERRDLNRLLSAHVRELPIEMFYGMLRAVRRERGAWLLEVSTKEHDHEIAARVVIDASGRGATFARRVGARRFEFDTLACIVGVFELAPRRMQTSLLVEATRDGWWYSVPLLGNRANVGYVTGRSAKAKTFDFAAELAGTVHVRERLDGAQLLSIRRAAGASAMLIPCSGKEGWFAIGDAAALLDPLCGAGVREAVRTGREVARQAVAALSGDATVFDEYALRMQRAFHAYSTARAAQYGFEQRWSTRPFWASRQVERFFTVNSNGRLPIAVPIPRAALNARSRGAREPSASPSHQTDIRGKEELQ